MLQVLGRAVKRGGVFLVGTTLLIAGAAMLVLPGPGIAVMLLGLVVLSAEFQWAQRVLAETAVTCGATSCRRRELDEFGAPTFVRR